MNSSCKVIYISLSQTKQFVPCICTESEKSSTSILSKCQKTNEIHESLNMYCMCEVLHTYMEQMETHKHEDVMKTTVHS